MAETVKNGESNDQRAKAFENGGKSEFSGDFKTKIKRVRRALVFDVVFVQISHLVRKLSNLFSY